jgi:hypothetical protein
MSSPSDGLGASSIWASTARLLPDVRKLQPPWAGLSLLQFGRSSQRGGSKIMSAKHKLNGAHVLGSLAAASLVGGFAKSWTVFFVALVGLVMAAFVTRHIRL